MPFIAISLKKNKTNTHSIMIPPTPITIFLAKTPSLRALAARCHPERHPQDGRRISTDPRTAKLAINHP
jgi:hypothetical protein